MKGIAGALSLLLCATPAASQSAAPRPRSQDETQSKRPARTYTNDDLLRTRDRTSAVSEDEPASVAPAETADAADGAEGAKEKSEEEIRAEKTATIAKEIAALTERAARIHQAMDDVQLELNDISSLTFGDRRAGLMKFLEDAQAELTRIDQSISDLTEQARREGLQVSRP